MRINEVILTETTEELQIVNKYAYLLAKKIIEKYNLPDEIHSIDYLETFEKKTPKNGYHKITKFLSVGLSNKSLSDFLNSLYISFSDESRTVLGRMMVTVSNKYIIQINIPAHGTNILQSGETLTRALRQTLVHEIQHAIDAYKSEFKANTKTADNYNSYLRLPHEINARFQEAMSILSEYVPRLKKQPQALVEFINAVFVETKLDIFDKTDPKYKRLLTRTYKFFKAEIENPKYATTETDIKKRAINFVLRKPSTQIHEHDISEGSSGYIPSKKQTNDPRFKTALTKDIKPDSIQKNAKALGFKTSRAGIPPQAKTNGILTSNIVTESFVSDIEEYRYISKNVEDSQKRLRLLEALGTKSLNEDSDYHRKICNKVIAQLGSLSATNVEIGKYYIPVIIDIFKGVVMFHDIAKNNPPMVEAEFGKLVQVTDSEFVLEFSGKTYKYPEFGQLTTITSLTILLDSVKNYESFRTVAAISFDAVLPSIKAKR